MYIVPSRFIEKKKRGHSISYQEMHVMPFSYSNGLKCWNIFESNSSNKLFSQLNLIKRKKNQKENL